MATYPKTEMDLKLKGIETQIVTATREITTELKTHTEVHEQILSQTTKTNGRVNKLELWQSMLMGGVGVLIFLFPFFMYYFGGILREIRHDVSITRDQVNSNTNAIHGIH